MDLCHFALGVFRREKAQQTSDAGGFMVSLLSRDYIINSQWYSRYLDPR